MEVAEIFDLVDWYRSNGPRVGKQYKNLQNVLQHNASQNQKQPVREQLHELVEGLNALPMTELNLQQVAQLDKIGVGQFLGVRGAEFVERVVTESGYDPATSASEMKTAADKVTSVTGMLESLSTALQAAGFMPDQTGDVVHDDTAIARIQFRQDASIENIAAMKKWSADWNDIVRGIGHLVDETPHDMKVVGASKGSIIVCVSGSMALISAFAFMSKKVSGVVLDVLKVQNAIEDLRHKRISNEVIERSMREDLKKRESSLVDDIIAELKNRAGGLAEEHDAHLRTAVKKYVEFSKKGGEMDYLQPPEPEADEEEQLQDQAQAHLIGELRGLISEIRSIKSETLRLEDLTVNDTE
ncbi:hypothetical protein SAMN05421853_1068 [Roseivivax halotolerans]|uniref:Uncharacterized protein n=1 Tax=Roseivivax halotolerans TaxID=93684 RepID=A0A1I5YKP1_9RHOB|nr:hypothetical protein [Roseivivax halotolerans]SFQ44457.1 hypothetical protein SAMN05421853_1068 [Roseivivax halotolerans]